MKVAEDGSGIFTRQRQAVLACGAWWTSLSATAPSLSNAHLSHLVHVPDAALKNALNLTLSRIMNSRSIRGAEKVDRG